VGFQIGRLEYGRLRADLQQLAGVLREGLPAAELRLGAIEAAEKGDTAKAIRIDCLSLKMAMPNIDTVRSDPVQAEKARAFLERARAEIARLEQAGNCSFGQAPKAD